MEVGNTLSYYDMAMNTAVKKFYSTVAEYTLRVKHLTKDVKGQTR
jgi:hypothetical protein